MRILIIRHGDPDYAHDSLTEKGFREAKLLAEKLKNEGITHIYASPCGRAQRTAEPTCEKLGLEFTVLDWLHELPAMLEIEYETDYYKNMHSEWNIPPELWVCDPKNYDINAWKESDIVKGTKIPEKLEYVAKGFDELLAKHGFVRDGGLYHIKEEAVGSKDTIALFCHGGVGTAMIAHVMNMPPIALWNSIFIPTSSVTTLYMEQHIKARPIAHGIFAGIADTSHLYMGNEPISCSGLHADILK